MKLEGDRVRLLRAVVEEVRRASGTRDSDLKASLYELLKEPKCCDEVALASAIRADEEIHGAEGKSTSRMDLNPAILIRSRAMGT